MKEHVVTLNHQSTIKYTLRGLDLSEIDSWSQFCASIFAYKENPPPPAYFARHFYNDPDRDPRLVRVAFYGNKMVASCRVFRRNISLGEDSVNAGGIGEVCTDPHHRRRGLSKALMKDCIDIMINEGMKVSLLHAAPDFFTLYQSMGFRNVLTEWIVLQVHLDRLPSEASSANSKPHCNIRNADFDRDAHELEHLYSKYSEARFCGCIVRSPDYWSNYLSQEIGRNLWIYPRVEDSGILGWMALRKRGDLYHLCEFGEDVSENMHPSVFLALLRHAAMHLNTPASFQLQVPCSLGRGLISLGAITIVEEKSDNGWMYKTLNESGVDFVDISRQVPHLIWPSDSF